MEAIVLTLICGGGMLFVFYMNGWVDRIFKKSDAENDTPSQSNLPDNGNNSH